jgi:hypothetical protein
VISGSAPNRLLQSESLINDQAVAAGRILAGRERAATRHRRAEHREQVRRNRTGRDPLGFSVPRQVAPGTRAGRGDVHRPAPLLEEGNGCARVDPRNAHQAARFGIGQGPHEQLIHQAEHGGVAADAQRQRQHGDGGEPRGAGEHAGGEPNVLEQSLQTDETPHITTVLPSQCDTAHLAVAEFDCGPGGESRAAVIGLFHGPVRLHLLGQFALELGAPPPEHEPPPGADHQYLEGPAHAISRTFWMAPTIRENSSRSAASRFLPEAVRV